MPCIRGACMKLFWGALGRLLYQDLVRFSPAAASPFMTILWDSLRGPRMKILVKVLYKSLWEAPVWILVKSSRNICKILYRSFWEALVGILLEFSSRSPCIKIMKMLRIVACMTTLLGCYLKEDKKVLLWRCFEILLDVREWGSGTRSWWVDMALLLVPKRNPAAALTIMSNLTCCCFISYCCLYVVHWLPNPHTVWGLLQV